MAQDIAKKYVKWGKDAIEKRAESLGPLITEVWDFDNPSRV
jgi:hypothetical protein